MCFSFIRLSSLNSSLCHQWSSTPNAQGIFKHVTNKNTQSGSTQILADKNITLRNIESPFTDVDLLRTKKSWYTNSLKLKYFQFRTFFSQCICFIASVGSVLPQLQSFIAHCWSRMRFRRLKSKYGCKEKVLRVTQWFTNSSHSWICHSQAFYKASLSVFTITVTTSRVKSLT